MEYLKIYDPKIPLLNVGHGLICCLFAQTAIIYYTEMYGWDSNAFFIKLQSANDTLRVIIYPYYVSHWQRLVSYFINENALFGVESLKISELQISKIDRKFQNEIHMHSDMDIDYNCVECCVWL